MKVAIEINGTRYEDEVEPRTLLSDFIRHQARLTGTHVGCEHGVCGACTVQLDGEPVRSCLMLAIQADGRALRTVEGLAQPGGALSPLQQAFTDHHALQCGFCTAGLPDDRRRTPPPSPDASSGSGGAVRQPCRCTG